MLFKFWLTCQLFLLVNGIDWASQPTSLEDSDEIHDISIANRIVGGEPASIKTYPYAISIQWRFVSRHHCGGSYIMSQFVLTAAHCLVRNKGYHWTPESPWVFVVLAGTADLTYSATWQIANVIKVLPHPYFNSHSMANDIGLLKISEPLRITHYVNYSPIPAMRDANLFNENAVPCTVIGWGKTNVASPVSSDTLRHVQIPLISTQECSKYFGHTLQPDQICAGRQEGGVDACQGDSGSPLICRGIQVGVVSWGHGCAAANSPGVYCRIDYYLEWINHTSWTNDSSSVYPSTFTSTLLKIIIFYSLILTK